MNRREVTRNIRREKVALGMSGGVDSSLCAHLLKEQGYDVTGIYLECWKAPGCRSEEDRADALKVALSLDIPFQVLDFKDAYKQKVVEYFFKEYEAGLTPNPDVMCNKEIKFGLFYDWAMEQGFDYVATGHYAHMVKWLNGKMVNSLFIDLPTDRLTNSPINLLAIPKDTHKDQTYFLYLITEEQLQHTIFPLAHFTKDEVRIEAQKRSIHVSNKKDSVGICFIGDIDVHKFLRDRLGDNPGDVVDTQGNSIGKHKGLWFYTVGQRSGFDIQAKTLIKQEDGSIIDKHNIPPFYVIRKNPEKNQLVVGFGSETMRDSFTVRNIHWINSNDMKVNTYMSQSLYVRIRHTGSLLKCTLENNATQLHIHLEHPIQGIAEGQSAVFYCQFENNYICLGGGIIS